MSKIMCAQICPFITDCSCDHLHTYTHLCLCVVFVNTAEHSPCARCNSVILSVRRCTAYRILLIVSENECSDKGRQCLRPFASNDKQRVQCRGRQCTQLLVLCSNLALTPVVTSLSLCPYLLCLLTTNFYFFHQVKTHMQLYPKQYPSLMATVMHISKSKGPQGLFSGLVPRMLRRTLVASMAWTVYEQMMKSVGIK